MARLSSEVLKDSLWFTKELGQKLAGPRKEQGLTQQQLAVLMGRRGQGNWTLVSAVELGRMKTPSLRLVADYLRACRSSFDDQRETSLMPTPRTLNACLGARDAAIEQLWHEAQELPASEHVDPARRKHFRGLLLHLCYRSTTTRPILTNAAS